MTQRNNSNAAQSNMAAYGKPMFIGGALALIMISMFVFSVKEPRPEWGSLWMIQPLIVSPLVGAMGGLFFFLVNYYGAKKGFNKYLTISLGLIGFIISLWMSIVLGLHGTMWN
jgi:hypothetical protein